MPMSGVNDRLSVNQKWKLTVYLNNLKLCQSFSHNKSLDRLDMLRFLMGLACLFVVFGCGERVPTGNSARILLLGDSMFASNKTVGGSVADAVEAALGLEVVDRSVPAARYFHALPISGSAGMNLTLQFREGPRDVIIVNGGGNDLLFGCGCGRCDGMLDRLISTDGRSGAIPSFVASLRKTGAQVVYAGYMRNPGTGTPIKACGPAGNELDQRLTELDKLDPGMVFLPMSDLVPYGSVSYHQIDRIHPSRIGSREIGLRIARAIGPGLGRPPGTYRSTKN
jgi:hypothetical protein